MGTYAQTTFAEAKQQLANTLGDPTKVYWTDAELGLYIIEALRAWGLATEYWRETVTLDTVAGEAFYDVPAYALDSGGNTILETSVSDRELINEALYQLIEPQITNWALPWPGTEMFSFSELTDALSKSRDDFFRESGMRCDTSTRVVTAGQRRVQLATNTLAIRRVAFQPVLNDNRYPMWCADQSQVQTTVEDAYQPVQGRPSTYSLNYLPTLAMDLWPTPETDGTLRMLVTFSLSSLAPTVLESFVSVTDDAAHLLKYAMMGNVIEGDGLARAPMLSRYCADRWQQGINQVLDYHLIVWAEINGKRVSISGLTQREMINPLWESESGIPKYVACPSWNMMVLSPVPDGVYTMTLEVVRPAPVPSLDADFLQIGREHMSTIYNYAQHVASFKLQGKEFTDTFPLLQAFFEAAKMERAKRAAQGMNYWSLERQGRMDLTWRPIWDEDAANSGIAEANARGAS